MIYNYHSLLLPAKEKQRLLAKGWLLLGIASLLTAGLLSILLVLSRTPYVDSFIPGVNFFHVALVVHVDLSVMIWFLAFAGAVWSLASEEKFILGAWTALILAAIGSIIIALSPFLGASHPLMNNYVPMLDDKIFIAGLIIFFLGIGLQALISLFTIKIFIQGSRRINTLKYGAFLSSLICISSLGALILSYLLIPKEIEGLSYYEILFWGGGHLLQFVHTALMLAAWLWLASLINLDMRLSPIFANILLSIFLAAPVATPLIYLSTTVNSIEHIQYFTYLMTYAMGIQVLIPALFIIPALISNPKTQETQAYRASLITSIALIGAGGIIGFLIEGVNVTIPSHYHGAIVGVTLAFMGVTYSLLPEFKYEKPKMNIAAVQLYVYALGQLLHIIGLAWAGGYGVQRKVTGAQQGLDTISKKLSMGVMGIGGMIAVIGGFLFLVIVLSAIFNNKRTTK
ncbi:cytochrome c oxidase subunit [Candidatus Magnetoovum chiemensis]|nr:cytochrome c oxidase subunit [Candidatus Magnetoovum chiemensis]